MKLRSSLGTIQIIGRGADAAVRETDERDKRVIFKNCTAFADCISKIHNTQIGNTKDPDVVMPMYNLIKDSDDYSKTSGRL